MTRITHTAVTEQREPFARPFGFKGAHFHEKVNARVRLTDGDGHTAGGIGGLAPLWADARAFTAHGEDGANRIMFDILRFALDRARETTFNDPPALLGELLEPVHAHAIERTGVADLSRTFTLNALVGLDLAAWSLYAQREGITAFDGLIPPHAQPAMAARHQAVAHAAAVPYNLDAQGLTQVLADGVIVLKVKLGQAGDEQAMMEKDLARFRMIHEQVAQRGSKALYYFDMNGRYTQRATLDRLLDEAEQIGALRRIMLIEEPFDAAFVEDLTDVPVRLGVDESLHDVADIPPRVQQGYKAMAIKPAGKGLTVAFDMAAAAKQHNLDAFVADNACVPALVEWNMHVAARLPAMSPLPINLIESNGNESYPDWDAQVKAHGKSWLRPVRGRFLLPDDFHANAGGLFAG